MANSIIGLHTGPGGNKTGLGNWITNANSKGIPVGLKAVDEYGPIFEAVNTGNSHSVNNWLAFRYTKASGKVTREVPNYQVNPITDATALAAEVILKLPGEFDKTAVFVELINEPRGKATNEPVYNGLHIVDYLGQWCHAAAVYLNGLGYKFCGPSFNSGEPGDNGQPLSDAVNQYSQPGMLKYLAHCANNPNNAALSVHDYIWSGPLLYPALWGRWEAAVAAADLAGIPRTFHIFVTEYGFSPTEAPAYPAAEPALDFYNGLAARFPQVKMAASWTLQSGYSPVDNQVNSWMNYPVDRFFTTGPQPAKTHSAFGATLPGETNMPTLQETLWNASQTEWTAQIARQGDIKYPEPLGGWKEQMRNIRRVPAHNENNLSFEGTTYTYQGFVDPFDELPYIVQSWSDKTGHFVVKEPAADGTPIPAPF